LDIIDGSARPRRQAGDSYWLSACKQSQEGPA